MRAGYLGPAGTFSHEALMAAGSGDELVPLPTLHETVLAVHAGTVDRALVPIENALEGSVNPTLDALAFATDDVEIVGELRHPVHHCLVGREPVALEEVRTVVSHPQATAQCAGFLREALPQARVVAAASTAEAVRQVAEGLQPAVALGTALAARLYGAVVLREHVEDDPANETRFVWVARRGAAPHGGAAPLGLVATPGLVTRWKTALVFWGAGSASPGWLVRCLGEFAARDVNLVRIESRPLRQRLGEYMFFLDLEGSAADPAVAGAVEGLRAHADVVRVLGSFPAA
ncbi:MAG: prephenate dehydratase [Solirubrobacteraceae bacterium]